MSQIITSVLVFIWTIIATRYLGVGDYGILATALSYTSFLSVFVDLGLSTYTTREVSRNPELSTKFLANILPIKLLLSVISSIILIIIVILLGYDLLNIQTIAILSVYTSINTFIFLYNSIIQANQKMKFTSIAYIITGIVNLLALLIVVYFDAGLLFTASIYVLGVIISLIYLIIISYKNFASFRLELDWKFWKKIIPSAIPFGIIMILSSVYYSTDTIMLSLFDGNIAVGLYSSAFRIITIFITLYWVYQEVSFPVMSNFYSSSKDLLKIIYEKSIKYLLFLVLPIAVIISCYSQDIIELFYGSGFQAASPILLILIWTMVILIINELTTSFLNATDLEISALTRNLITAIGNAILNLIFIPLWTYIGAGIATLITQILLLIMAIYIVIKNLFKPSKELIISLFKVIILNTILLIIILILKIELFYAIILFTILYIIGTYLFKIFDKQDKKILDKLKE